MLQLHLHVGLQYMCQDQKYEVTSLLPGNFIQVINLSTGILGTVHESTITKQILEKEISLLSVSAESLRGPQPGKLEYSFSDFTMLPRKQRIKAYCRYVIVSVLLRMKEEERTGERAFGEAIDEALEQLCSEYHMAKRPSRRTAYRWVERYLQSGKKIGSLVPAYGKCGKGGYIHQDVEKIVKDVINKSYLRRERPTIQQTFMSIVGKVDQINQKNPQKGLNPPCYATVWHRIKAMSPYDVMAARYGTRAAEQKYRLVGNGVTLTRILQRVEMDHTPLKVILGDLYGNAVARATLTVALCAYSRYPLGFYIGFENPSYQTITACLEHAIQPKDYVRIDYPSINNKWDAYGLPEVIAIDRGKDFQSQDLEHACAQLGIQVIDLPVYSPWYKGTVERFFRTIHDGVVAGMRNRTFSNVVQKRRSPPGEERPAHRSFCRSFS